MLMNSNDSELKDANVAAREKGLIVAREFDRVVHTFNKVLKYKENCAKSLRANLHGLAKKLEENLNDQSTLNHDLEIFDANSEKIILNLQHLESEERTHAGRYEDLLRGVEINGVGLESENLPTTDVVPGENNEDALEKLKIRRDKFIANLNHEFQNLDEKLASIEKLKNELEESRKENKQKKVQAWGRKEALEEQGKKLLNEVGRLERELETTILEEKNLVERSVEMVKQVENSLELDEKIDHVLFSSLTLAEPAEVSPESELAGNKR